MDNLQEQKLLLERIILEMAHFNYFYSTNEAVRIVQAELTKVNQKIVEKKKSK